MWGDFMNTTIDSNSLRELIRTLVRNLGVLEKDEMPCCGVTLGQCHAIVEIGRAKDISLNHLAELLNLDKSTMSRTVNNLVHQGLAERKIDTNDRRYIKIQLTRAGNEVFNNIEKNMENYYHEIFKSLPVGKSEQVIESLNLLIMAIKKNKCC